MGQCFGYSHPGDAQSLETGEVFVFGPRGVLNHTRGLPPQRFVSFARFVHFCRRGVLIIDLVHLHIVLAFCSSGILGVSGWGASQFFTFF